MNLKNGKVFTSKFVGTGPSSNEKRIYRSAVSQRLRNTAIDTLSEYVILIASLWQQWLRERIYMLCHTHIGCLVTFSSLLNISIILLDLFLLSSIITIIPNYTRSWYDWI